MTQPQPKISIVTPSFNQASFLEETIRSVLDQNYPNLEYIVIDGGSTDGSIDILRRYAPRLAYWVSEPDRGHYDALNKGFARSTGEVMAWLNSDDKHTPWALSVVGEIFGAFSDLEWLTSLFPLHWDARGRAISCGVSSGFSREGFLRGENLPGGDWHSTGWIQQESTFWRRSLWERVGARLDDSLKLAGDFDLWGRFSQSAELYAVSTPLGGFRLHDNQQTGHHASAYFQEAHQILLRSGGRIPGRMQSFMLARLHKLILWLERKYQRRLLPFAPQKILVHQGRAGSWRLKTP